MNIKTIFILVSRTYLIATMMGKKNKILRFIRLLNVRSHFLLMNLKESIIIDRKMTICIVLIKVMKFYFLEIKIVK